MSLQPIPTTDTSTLGDGRRWPGSRFQLVCSLCGWSKTYRVERVIERLRQLKAGGHATTLTQVARRVGWNCPGCGRVKWRGGLAWPLGIDAREAKRQMRIARD
jgi:hypothetical protein